MLFNRSACTISDEDTMVLTGGYHTKKKAHRYNENGFLEALANLNKERVFHSCAKYINKEDKTVKMSVSCRISSTIFSDSEVTLNNI